MLDPASASPWLAVRSCISAAVAVVFATAFAAAATAATLYKWTDASGRVVYSDQPPPGNIKAEIIGGAPPPSNPNAMRELVAKDQQISKRMAEKVDDAKKTDKTRADADVKWTACKTLRLQVVQLNQSQVVVYTLNEKGEQVAMDDAERARQLVIAERLLRDYQCPPA